MPAADRPAQAHPETFEPTLSDEDAKRIRRWHEHAYDGLRRRERMEIDDFGVRLAVPPDVFAPTPMSDVMAVDINPAAMACARSNAEANGLAERVTCLESDVFDRVEGRFDLILFDPPFRWFRPRDLLEAAITDENYAALTRFMHEVPDRLNDGGRVLLSFGTSADVGYLRSLIDRPGLAAEVLDDRSLDKDGWTVTYYAYRLTKHGSPAVT